MNSNRKTALIVGVLYIVATVADIISAYIEPDTDASYYLASHENQVLIGGLFEFTVAVLIVGISTYLYPILKKYNEAFGSGFLPFFGYDPRSTIYLLMDAPSGLNEMVFAVWLIVKGFNPSAIPSGSVKRI